MFDPIIIGFALDQKYFYTLNMLLKVWKNKLKIGKIFDKFCSSLTRILLKKNIITIQVLTRNLEKPKLPMEAK